MPRYVSTIRFTDQGSVAIRDTVKRSKAFKSAARKLGVKVRETYWTQGPFDGLIVFDAPDEESVAALLLDLNSLGNVRTQTCRAFDAAEMEQVLSKIE